MKMNKSTAKKLILEELTKENWDSLLIEKIVGEVNGANKLKKVLSRVSDELPKIAASVCNVELVHMITGVRKAEVMFALKLVYKELKDNHGYTYQRIANRFNRGTHDNIMSALKDLNNRLETNDPVSVRMHQEFRNEVDALKIMLTL